MDKGKRLTIQINLDYRVLIVLFIVGIVLFWVVARAGAQTQNPTGLLDTNNPAAPPVVQPAPIQTKVSPQTTAPEPGMLPDTNLDWIRPEELGIGFKGLAQPNAISANPTYPRHFYLTENSFTCANVLTACASGYHTASLWEILDVTSLIYDYDQAAAHKQADSGWGPPSAWNGWVRTGYFSSNSTATGTGNCNNWTSVSEGDHGVSVRLSRTWESAPGDINAWDATAYTCNFTGPVWCVMN